MSYIDKVLRAEICEYDTGIFPVKCHAEGVVPNTSLVGSGENVILMRDHVTNNQFRVPYSKANLIKILK